MTFIHSSLVYGKIVSSVIAISRLRLGDFSGIGGETVTVVGDGRDVIDVIISDDGRSTRGINRPMLVVLILVQGHNDIVRGITVCTAEADLLL